MEPKSDRTRRYIIEKSAHLFNRKGYHGTSMSDILEATGMAKGGIYGHFKGKNEIVAEAFEFAFYRVLDEQSIRIRSHNTALEKLDAIVDYYRDFVYRAPIEGGCPIMNYSTHSGDIFPELTKLISRATYLMLESLERIIEKGKKYGQIRADINSVEYAELVFSRIEGAMMIGKSTQDNSRVNRLLDRLQADMRRELPA